MTETVKTDDLVRRLLDEADGIEEVDFERRSMRRGYEQILREAVAALRQSDTRIEGGGEALATGSIPAHAKWCQPGDQQEKRMFIVRFDDPDRQDAVFSDEADARAFYARATINWNCYLFGALEAFPPTPEHVEGDVLSVGEMEVRAWLHTLHMEHGQKSVTADLEEEHPFGESGEDFDPSYNVTSEPLVTLSSAQSRIQRAERERDEAVEYASTSSTSKLEAANGALLGRVASLEAQLADAVKDAQRYRYLRGRDLEVVHSGGVFAGMTPENVVLNGNDLDAAVDLAISTIGEKPDAE